eukprot:9469041-Pyramimonas_sp.AAC.2
MEPQVKPQKPNHHMMMDGVLRSTRNRRPISRRMSWKCGMLNYNTKWNCWRQLHQRTFSQCPHRWFQIKVC